MPLDTIITVPHGARGNDVLGPPVGQLLHRRLAEVGWSSKVFISRADRLDRVDMNRVEGRGSQFRKAVAETLANERPRYLVDCHSFPDYHEPYEHADIVLLETPGLTDRVFLETYTAALNTMAAVSGLAVGPGQDFFATIKPAQFPDDVLIQAAELGQPASSFFLAEHNESGDPALFAAAHAGALTMFLRKLGEDEDDVPEVRGTPEEQERLEAAEYMECRVPFRCGNCRSNGGTVLDGRFTDPLACIHPDVVTTVERAGCCRHFVPMNAGDLLRGSQA